MRNTAPVPCRTAATGKMGDKGGQTRQWSGLVFSSRARRASGARQGEHGELGEGARRRWRVALPPQEVNAQIAKRPLDSFSFLQLSPLSISFISFKTSRF